MYVGKEGSSGVRIEVEWGMMMCSVFGVQIGWNLYCLVVVGIKVVIYVMGIELYFCLVQKEEYGVYIYKYVYLGGYKCIEFCVKVCVMCQSSWYYWFSQ